MPSRYEFLSLLHQQLQPRGYLEVGVQLGGSLSLAQCPAIGIDPNPLVQATGNQHIFTMTSDEYFANHEPDDIVNLDLVYLDGSHLFEDTLRDFVNVEKYANRNTVVVFDDVLPYNAEIGMRHQPPGDWCGDVWKVAEIIEEYRPDLGQMLVDSWPVGALVVWNLDVDGVNTYLEENWNEIMDAWNFEITPPDDVINRTYARSVPQALETLRNR